MKKKTTTGSGSVFFFYFNKKKSLMVSIKMMLRIQTVQKKKNEAKETESHLIIQQLEPLFKRKFDLISFDL